VYNYYKDRCPSGLRGLIANQLSEGSNPSLSSIFFTNIPIFINMNIKKIIREEIGDFDWIKDTNPSPLNTIIVFEPMITEDDYSKVLEVLELDESVHTNTGHINTLNPFMSYDYLHHLLIDVNGKTVYGGSNYDDYEEREDLEENIVDYTSTFPHRFKDPIRVDGRKYFNI
jgi:hypothetical protein